MVPIDSTTLNHFLFTEPHACTLPFFSMCVRGIHNLEYIFCWNKVNPCQIRIYFSNRHEWFVSRRKIFSIFMRRWLGVTDDWRRSKKQLARKVNFHDDWWNKGYDISNIRHEHTEDKDERWPLSQRKSSLVGWPAHFWEHKKAAQWQQCWYKTSWRGLEMEPHLSTGFC